MITRFITEVAATFNPFSPRAKICRTFIAQFGPATYSNVKFNTNLLPRASQQAAELKVTFQDGKVLQLDPQKLSVKDVMEEVDRHSRMLGRKAELSNN